MKTLIINGSPRKNGDNASLIKELLDKLNGDVKIINTYYDNIKPCIDCRYCWSNPECSIKDDMQDIYQSINEVDNIVIASPLYFSELTGSLLNFASRFQLFYASRVIRKDPNFHLKAKRGFLILTGGGDTEDISKALSTAKTLFKIMGASLIGSSYSLQTDKTPAINDINAINSIKDLAIKLNSF